MAVCYESVNGTGTRTWSARTILGAPLSIFEGGLMGHSCSVPFCRRTCCSTMWVSPRSGGEPVAEIFDTAGYAGWAVELQRQRSVEHGHLRRQRQHHGVTRQRLRPRLRKPPGAASRHHHRLRRPTLVGNIGGGHALSASHRSRKSILHPILK